MFVVVLLLDTIKNAKLKNTFQIILKWVFLKCNYIIIRLNPKNTSHCLCIFNLMFDNCAIYLCFYEFFNLVKNLMWLMCWSFYFPLIFFCKWVKKDTLFHRARKLFHWTLEVRALSFMGEIRVKLASANDRRIRALIGSGSH